MKRERNHALVSHASDGMHAHRHLHSLFFAISIHDDDVHDDDENRSIAGEVNGRTRKKYNMMLMMTRFPDLPAVE